MLFESDRMARLLSDVVDGTATLTPEIEAELHQDLRFQAEVARYRKMLRALHALRDDIVDPGPAFVDDVIDHLDDEAEPHALRAFITNRRAAYVGGAIAAASLGGAFVLARRRRAA